MELSEPFFLRFNSIDFNKQLLILASVAPFAPKCPNLDQHILEWSMEQKDQRESTHCLN